MQHNQELVNPNTLEGIYNGILLRTGDKELAERTSAEVHAQIKINQLKNQS